METYKEYIYRIEAERRASFSKIIFRGKEYLLPPNCLMGEDNGAIWFAHRNQEENRVQLWEPRYPNNPNSLVFGSESTIEIPNTDRVWAEITENGMKNSATFDWYAEAAWGFGGWIFP